MLNIFHNFIPNKNMIRNDKGPPWFNKKNHLFKSYMAISRLTVALHEKPYFLSSGISWKAKKDQVNIIFPSTSWLKKDRTSHHRKVQNKNFSVISKYHLFHRLLGSKRDRISHHRKVHNKNISVISKYHLYINFMAQITSFFIPKISKQELFSYQ